MSIDEVVTEVGSGMNAKRRRLARLLSDPTVTTIVVERRDRLAGLTRCQRSDRETRLQGKASR